MWKKVLLVAGSCMITLVPSVAASGASVSKISLTADQLIRNSVSASGGESAWQKVMSMRMVGQMDVGQGMQVPYIMQLKRGRKVRVEIVFEDKTAVQVYDGKNGWKRRPFLGRNDVEPFSPDEQQKAALDSDLDGLLIGYQAKGTRPEIEGEESVEGRDAYKLKLTLKDGQVRRVWIDAQTYLQVKMDGTRRMDGKDKTVETFFRDYRTVDGIKVPFIFETAVNGVKATGKIYVEKVSINPPIDDSAFAKLR